MNQLQTNDQVKNLINIRKSLKRGKAGNLAENSAFLDFLAIQKQMTAEIDATWDVIKERMDQYDIKKIDGDWGYITMAERKNFSIAGLVAPRFTKRVLDNSQVAAYMKLHKNNLPTGVAMSTSRFLQKKIKLA